MVKRKREYDYPTSMLRKDGGIKKTKLKAAAQYRKTASRARKRKSSDDANPRAAKRPRNNANLRAEVAKLQAMVGGKPAAKARPAPGCRTGRTKTGRKYVWCDRRYIESHEKK